MVEGFAVWGVRPTIERLIGMFAFAAWDRSTHTLTLARDRLGIKPLYWGHANGSLVFASELKALKAVPGWRGEIDPQRAGGFPALRLCADADEHLSGDQEARARDAARMRRRRRGQATAYWSLSEVAARGQASLLDVTDAAAQEMLESLLADAVRRRMVADVPLGMFLSGGIDSSTVAALMQANSARPIRTFSIGFREPAYDEAAHAKQVAAHLGTEHTELYVTPAEARAVIPKLQDIYDEPFADSSQIPTYLVSEMTRRHVTVALSGDGGDEVFAGYNRYGQGLALARMIRTLAEAHAASDGRRDDGRPARHVGLRLPRWCRDGCARAWWATRFTNWPRVLPEDSVGFYRHLVTQWPEASSLVEGAAAPDESLYASAVRERFPDDVSWMQYLDTLTYLPDDILAKVDRASMAVALEVRVPLLDHRVVELSWRLPQRFKLRGGMGKWLLRQIAYKYVPKALLERPKMGFGVPIDQWLRGPLKEWAGDLLSSSAMNGAGLLNREPIAEKWAEHQAGARNWQYFLWNVLMFEAWNESNQSQERGGMAVPSLRPRNDAASGISVATAKLRGAF